MYGLYLSQREFSAKKIFGNKVWLTAVYHQWEQWEINWCASPLKGPASAFAHCSWFTTNHVVCVGLLTLSSHTTGYGFNTLWLLPSWLSITVWKFNCMCVETLTANTMMVYFHVWKQESKTQLHLHATMILTKSTKLHNYLRDVPNACNLYLKVLDFTLFICFIWDFLSGFCLHAEFPPCHRPNKPHLV